MYYFSHTSFSPNNTQVYFLLRSSNSVRNSSQLFVYNLINNKLKVLPTSGMVSHLCWLSDNKILAYSNVINGEDGYYTFDTETLAYQKVINAPNVDGHPFRLDEDYFITDTYPNRYRRQKLFKVGHTNSLINETILDIYSPFKFRNEERVDLHPRLSLCSNYITIDTSFKNERYQLVIKI
jgi:hypothetical protein